MQLSGSVTIDLPATAAIDDAESAILAAGRHAMRLALCAAAQMLQAQLSSCPACPSSTLHADGTVQRIVLTSFGRVPIPVLRKRCPACGLRFRASTPFLAPLAADNITPRLARPAADAGSSWPYVTAASWLHDTLEAQISPESVRRCTNRYGTLAAHEQVQEATQLVDLSASAIRAARDAELAAPLRLAPPPAPPLLVELDGGWIASRDIARGMEGKLSVVATGRQRLTAERGLLAPRRYAATVGSAERLGPLTYAAASVLNGVDSPQQVVLGDGAEWIQTQAAWQFPDAVKILDWSHLERAMHKAIRVACPGKERKRERARLYAEVGGALWEGRVDDGLKVLAAVKDGDGKQPVQIEHLMSYVRGQRDWLGDYGAWRRRDIQSAVEWWNGR